jgi:hypothetical protein
VEAWTYLPRRLTCLKRIAGITSTSSANLACNGVARVRVSGKTPKQAERNAALQAIGLLWPGDVIGWDRDV